MTRPQIVVAVVGTATDIGKTWVTCRLVTELRAAGRSVSARKPAQSFEPDGTPTDADLLAAATGERAHSVCPLHRWYEVPMAPPMAAAALHREPLTADQLLDELVWPEQADVGFVETAGGVRSPLTDDADSAGFVARLEPDDVVLVGDAGLGTINSVRLSAAALGVPVIVHLNRFDAADDLHRRNLAWLTTRDGFEVTTDPADLATRLADASQRAPVRGPRAG